MEKQIYRSTLRHYRKKSANSDEYSFQVVLEETDLWITALKSAGEDLPERILETVREVRKELEDWIARDPRFISSLVPINVSKDAPAIVQRMARGAKLAGVGPMACVAGAVAEAVATKFSQESPELIVENGGDIYVYSQKERRIGLLPDPENNITLGLLLPRSSFPVAVCSSSATIGHSLSFGDGELATVLAKDASLADACATAFCNALKKAEDIELVLKKARRMEKAGVKGVFLQCAGQIGLWGEMELDVVSEE